MSVEFRQRTPGEYARILWKRKWLIVLPTIAVAFAVAWVVWRLPNIYESATLLTVRPATISTSVVPRLSDSDLTIRINNIGQVVVSRSSLEPLIEKYNLYATERRRGEPMDSLVERMRGRDISVKINTSRNDITNGFNIYFRGPEPKTAQAVAAELATKYVNAQTKAATEESTQTKEFFDVKLRQAKEELDAIDKQRLSFMISNKNNLPSASAALVERLSGLYEQQKTYVTEIGRLRDQFTAQSNLLSDTDKQRKQQIMDVEPIVGDPKQSPAYAAFASHKAELESQLQKLLSQYKAKHPDVIQKQAEIGTIERQMDELVEDGKRRIEERRKMLENSVDLRFTTYKSTMASIEAEIKRQQKQLAATEAQIASLEQRINEVPSAEVGLSALDREYQSKKSVYDDLLNQAGKADIAASVALNAQGESIAVIDPASLPEKPVAPNRMLLMALGLMLGLGAGFAIAAAFEVPRLLTIQTL
ncbi:MAG TPA: GNVR domain-containing protein, partial [Pyrinomonadaceae bacterium]|nr:GNVR domain-containing protein [Pyrinomonadaceae bacterium]